jgi:hypothetical protein
VHSFEGGLGEQRDHPVPSALRSAFQFDDEFLAMPRYQEVGRNIIIVIIGASRFFDDLPAFLTEQVGHDPPELGFVVDG